MKKFVMTAALVGLLSVASPTNAQTMAEFQAIIAAFLAQADGVTATTTTSGSFVYGGGLIQVGSRGQQVMDLQECLAELGVNSSANIDGVFGSKTKAAVMSFQASSGVAVDGIIGSVTGPLYTAACATQAVVVVPPVTTLPETSGKEASLEGFELDSEDDAEEGKMTHVATIEFDVEDGDVVIERLDLTFDNGNVGGTADLEPWDVYETLTLMVDGDEIASEDIDDEDDWNRDNNPTVYRLNGLDLVVEDGDTAKIEVYLTTQNNVDDATNANWTIFVGNEGIRGTDTAGITQYVGAVGDTVSFNIDEEGGDEDITIKSSNNNPDSSLLQVDEDDEEMYEVFVFELEADENDIDLEDLVLVVNTVEGSYDDLINDMKIEIDGEDFDDFSVVGGGTNAATITFDIDKDFTVDGDSKVDVTVSIEFRKADLNNNGTADGAYDDFGVETIQVGVTSISGEGVDNVSDTSTLLGSIHTLSLAAATIENISWATTSSDKTGVIDFLFTVDNSDSDEDFDVLSADITDVATAGFVDAGTPSTLSGEGILSRVSGDSVTPIGTTGFRVAEGDRTRFRVRYEAATAGSFEVSISEIAGVEIDDADELSPTLILEA
jgi:hypothetical protein